MRTIEVSTPSGVRYTVIFDECPANRYRWVPSKTSKIIGIDLFYDLEKSQTIDSISIGGIEQLAMKCPAQYFRGATPEIVGFTMASTAHIEFLVVNRNEAFDIILSEPINALAIHYREAETCPERHRRIAPGSW